CEPSSARTDGRSYPVDVAGRSGRRRAALGAVALRQLALAFRDELGQLDEERVELREHRAPGHPVVEEVDHAAVVPELAGRAVREYRPEALVAAAGVAHGRAQV